MLALDFGPLPAGRPVRPEQIFEEVAAPILASSPASVKPAGLVGAPAALCGRPRPFPTNATGVIPAGHVELDLAHTQTHTFGVRAPPSARRDDADDDDADDIYCSDVATAVVVVSAGA
jgi:hypothetical protein